MSEKSTDRLLDLILSQLEKLNENQEKLSEEIQKTNLEITKISGIKHAVFELNKWKDGIGSAVNADDLSKIKDFYSKHQDINADLDDLFLIAKELRNDAEDYKKFKIKTMTIIAVVSFLFTTGMIVLGWFIK